MTKNQKSLDINIMDSAEQRFARQSPPMRLVGGLLDAVFVLVLAAIIAFAGGIPLANNAGMKRASMTVTATLYLSGLYEVNENDSVVVIDEIDKYPSALYNYYVDRVDENLQLVRGLSPLLDSSKSFNSVDDYYDHILLRNELDTPFDFTVAIDEATPWIVAVKEGKNVAARSLYRDNFTRALDYLFLNETLVEATYIFYQLFFIALTGSFVIAALILIVLLPLITKDGASLGKRFTKTTLANKYGYRLTKVQTLYRGLSGFLLYYLLFILPIGFVSLLMMALTKSQSSLVDRISLSVVLDKNASVIYANAAEERHFNVQRAKNIVRMYHLSDNEKNDN